MKKGDELAIIRAQGQRFDGAEACTAVGAAAAVGDGGYTTLRALLDWLAR